MRKALPCQQPSCLNTDTTKGNTHTSFDDTLGCLDVQSPANPCPDTHTKSTDTYLTPKLILRCLDVQSLAVLATSMSQNKNPVRKHTCKSSRAPWAVSMYKGLQEQLPPSSENMRREIKISYLCEDSELPEDTKDGRLSKPKFHCNHTDREIANRTSKGTPSCQRANRTAVLATPPLQYKHAEAPSCGRACRYFQSATE